MDIEYIANVIAGRVRDYILYNKDENHNTPAEAAFRYQTVRLKLRGLVGIDELEHPSADLDRTPRYAPDEVRTVYGRGRVIGIASYPPDSHPANCPLVKDCVALELRSTKGSRWYGVEKAYINSELRMVVIGFSAGFEEMQKWEKVPADRV